MVCCVTHMEFFCLLFICLFFVLFVCSGFIDRLFVLPCILLKSEWLFVWFYTLIFLSINVQVDSVCFSFHMELSFIFLLQFVCSILMPSTFLLLHHDVNIMYVCIYRKQTSKDQLEDKALA